MPGNQLALQWTHIDGKEYPSGEIIVRPHRDNSMTTQKLTDLLKLSNINAHRQLEDVIDIMNPEMTVQDYSTLIRRFYGYIAPWEDCLRRSLPESLKTLFTHRFKTAWLLKDLQVLQETGLLHGECRGATSGPFCAKLPDLSTPARLLGSAYVIEGSSLGSRIIAAHLARCFGTDNDIPRNYFECYGAETGRMWKSYLSTMTSTVPEERYPEVLDAAAQTFASLNEWFSEIKRRPTNCHA